MLVLTSSCPPYLHASISCLTNVRRTIAALLSVTHVVVLLRLLLQTRSLKSPFSMSGEGSRTALLVHAPCHPGSRVTLFRPPNRSVYKGPRFPSLVCTSSAVLAPARLFRECLEVVAPLEYAFARRDRQRQCCLVSCVSVSLSVETCQTWRRHQASSLSFSLDISPSDRARCLWVLYIIIVVVSLCRPVS